MGFGISGFVKGLTKKALIRYVDPLMAQYKTLEQIDAEAEAQGLIAGYIQSSLNELVGIVKTITPDVRKSEVHKLRSNVTETAMEDGSIVSQHVIQRPVEITLQFEETNAGKMISNIIGAGLSLLGAKRETTFDKLYEIWEQKIPVQIVTEQKIYNNMVIESMPIIHKQPYKGALQIMCDFKQLNFYTAGTFPYKGSSKNINKSVSPRVEGGTQTTVKVGG